MCFATLIVGVVGVGLQFMFGYNTITYISRENINNVWIYKYDFWGYVDNIKTSITTPNLDLNLPTRQWGWNPNDTINDLAYILDIIIMLLNVVIYPLRIGALVVRTLLSFVGINVINPTSGNPLAWLVSLLQTINTLAIPYV